jgi:YVTN family beta-propeller protein
MNRRFFLKPSMQWFATTLLLIAAAAIPAFSQWDNSNWGLVVAPVYNSSETGFYAGAELFAGPNKFGSYFAGVTPNGRKLTPAGTVVQTGMNPLGMVLTPDGKYLITSNDDEREGGFPSFQNPLNVGGYSLNVIDTATMTVKSQITTGKFFIGIQATGSGPYTIWASGGPVNQILLYTVQTDGTIAAGPTIAISPIAPSTAGFVSNYVPDAHWNQAQGNGFKPPVPTNFDRVNGAQTTFPAGSALSPDGKWLYVACNGDNSIAVIDTTTQKVVQQVPVGYFPYAVSVSADGTRVMVSNWGVTEYKFQNPTYDGTGKLSSIGTTGNEPFGFFVPVTDAAGDNPKTSSVSILSAPNGDGSQLTLLGSVYQGHALDDLNNVGDTHPSAVGIVIPSDRRGEKSTTGQILYVALSNSDTIGLIDITSNQAIGSLDLSLFPGKPTHGTQPNAIVISPDNTRVYVAEAGINSVAVLDSSIPSQPKLLGRIPTDWYPTAVTLSSDGRALYVANAKGIGEDVNPSTRTDVISSTSPPTGLISTPQTDSNYIFGTVQKVDLNNIGLDDTTVRANNYKTIQSADTSAVPIGGGASGRVKHVVFILQENKTFDSMLGNLGRFGRFASLNYNAANGSYYYNGQYTGVDLNLQQLAGKFAVGVNFYSDSEESDAGHQFCASGMASDYTEKTLLVKSGRGLLVNKNFDPEDYPEHGYIYNNAARNGVSFKLYGLEAARILGTDTGTSQPTTLNDPPSGLTGAPKLQDGNFHITQPLVSLGDVTTPVSGGVGHTFFMTLPGLAIVGGKNANGEDRLDKNYPGYNFNISDQRRAQEFISDFDRMIAQNTVPQFIYLYLPNDHTGSRQAPNDKQVFGSASNVQQVADGDVALGMVIKHIMQSPIYYDKDTNTGFAIIQTFDDAQSTLDHIHPHRNSVTVVSPFAKPGYYSTRHYNSASIVKTEELLLGLPPNNLGDLMATDLRDFFQPTNNGITADQIKWDFNPTYTPSPEGTKIWSLVNQLDTSAPDRDSHRLGQLGRLSMAADDLHNQASKDHKLNTPQYKRDQAKLYQMAVELVSGEAPKDND